MPVKFLRSEFGMSDIGHSPTWFSERGTLFEVKDAENISSPGLESVSLWSAARYGQFRVPETGNIFTTTAPMSFMQATQTAGDTIAGAASTVSANNIVAGLFLARASYGGKSIGLENDHKNGYLDNYRSYLANLDTSAGQAEWKILSDIDLGSHFVGDGSHGFKIGGLYVGRPATSLPLTSNHAEALLAETEIDGQKTLVLAFRGSDGADAAYEMQTFVGLSSAVYYEALRPLIEAARRYAEAEGISNLVVSGHSLGGTMVDIFTLVDAKSFLEISGLNLSVVSIASAGVDEDVARYLDVKAEFADKRYITYDFTLNKAIYEIERLIKPSFHVDLGHTEDRVRFPKDKDGPFSPNDLLISNLHFSNNADFQILLPNLDNFDVLYVDGDGDVGRGFGAEHNDELYWINFHALLKDPLLHYYSGSQKIVMGITDYTQATDIDGHVFPFNGWSIFRDYLPVDDDLNPIDKNDIENDRGARRLAATDLNPHYILGLTGNDQLFGAGGNDLLSGGEGDDYLRGLQGRDILHGGAGSDILIGDGATGSSSDILTGGQDGDTFRYNAEDIPPPGTRAPVFLPQFSIDEITDYNQGNTVGAYDASEGDVIDVSAIVGTVYNGGTGDAEEQLVRTIYDSGLAGAVIEIDIDGTGTAHTWVPFAYLHGLRPGDDVNFKLDPSTTGLPVSALPAAAPLPGFDVTMKVLGDPGSWSISPPSRTVTEGNRTITFTVTRPNDATAETVYVSTTINQGSLNDGDYHYWLNEPVTFAVGETVKTIDIDIRDDSTAEGMETFGLIVQSFPTQPASLYLAQSTFTIIDDDVRRLSSTFTENDDVVWIKPTGGAQTFDGLAGSDAVVVDLTGWDGGISTGALYGSHLFTQGSESVQFWGVEAFFVLGGDGSDYLYGGNLTDGLFGGAGNDLLDGGDGADVLDGGAGDDTFYHVDFGDVVNGGAGIDRVAFDLRAVTTGMDIDLANGTGLGGLWTGIESATGTFGNGDDTVNAGFQSIYLNGNGGIDHLILDYSGTDASGRSADHVSLNVNNNGDGAVFWPDSTYTRFALDGFERFTVTGSAGNDGIKGAELADTLRGEDGDDYLDGHGGADILIGGAGNDVLAGGDGADVLDGGAGNDRLNGGDGADVMDGGAGDDYFYVDFGDVVFGGSGSDTVSCDFSSATVGLVADLVNGTGVDGLWSGIEVVEGTFGTGDDTVNAGFQTSDLNGNGGTDHLTLDYSGAGPGRLDYTFVEVLLGYDILNGNDYGVFFYKGQRDLSHDPELVLSINLTGFEQFTVTGSGGNDRIVGGSLTDILRGGAGDDWLEGRGGIDVLDGGAGDDQLDLGTGNGTVNGGAGIDTLGFSLNSLTVGVAADLTSGSFTSGGGTIAWTGIEAIAGTFTVGDDTVNAGFQALRLIGNGGVDHLTLDYSGTDAQGRSAAQVHLSLHSDYQSETVWWSSGGTSFFSLISFERFTVTGSAGNDTIYGGGLADILRGGIGDDQLYGNDGADVLDGGAGDDILNGGGGADVLDGGAGDDVFHDVGIDDVVSGGSGTDTVYFDFTAATTGLIADLAARTGVDGLWSGIEAASGTFGQGDDTVNAGFQTRSLHGHSGIDHLTLDYSGTGPSGVSATGVQLLLGSSGYEYINLSDGTTAQFDLNGFERFTVTGSAGDDTVYGAAMADTLRGGGGNDKLYGNEGADILVGGAGDDILNGGGGADVLDGGAGDDVFHDVGSGDVVSGGSGSDTVYFNFAAATVGLIADLAARTGVDGLWSGIEVASGTFGQGDDTVNAGFQTRSLNGHSGTDHLTLDYSGTDATGRSAASVYLVLYASSSQIVYWADSTSTSFALSGFERFTVTGSAGDDTVHGAAMADTLRGGAGNDYIDGREGADSLVGGAGNDTLVGREGADILVGGAGNDVLHGGDGADVLDGGAGDDFFGVDFGDLVSGGSGFDTAYFDLRAATTGMSFDFTSGTGADGLWTGIEAGSGTFSQGDDTVNAGFQTGYLDGHTGTDHLTLDFSGVHQNGRTASKVTLLLQDDTAAERVKWSGGGFTDFHLKGFERFTVTGSAGNDSIQGAGLADDLNGGAGRDTIDGGDGADQLFGNKGNDRLLGGGGGDRLDGANGNDSLFGEDGYDKLVGGTGHDLLIGGNGRDYLNAGGGNDILIGGAGRDTYIGGAGKDTFRFDDITDSLKGRQADVIRDFVQGSDVIDLSRIDAVAGAGDQAFAFIGSAQFGGTAGELRYKMAAATTKIFGDIDGDGRADFMILCTGAIDFQVGDFLL